jgi:hypothetical protein
MNCDFVLSVLSNRTRSRNIAGVRRLSLYRRTVARSTGSLIGTTRIVKKSSHLNACHVWRPACNEMIRDQVRKEESYERYSEKNCRCEQHCSRNTP